MIYQSGYERGQSRERSRDAERKHNNRSPSEDSNYRKYHTKEVKPRGKRVKPLLRFEEDPDVKVFRKEDEPSARGLLQQQILNIKNQIEKQIAKSYDFNWQHFKHRDALSESNSMKYLMRYLQQKQKEKALVEKLMSAKQSMSYFYPPSLRYQKNMVQIGSGSSQREGHTLRIHDILGCYYTHVSQIPNQPQFQILNTNTSSESKLIKFDNDMINDGPTFGNIGKKNIDNAKNIKGILKVPGGNKERSRSESSRTVDPQLIFILKDAKLNPNNYSKERVEAMLKPYKDSGELEYLMKNKEVLQSMLRNTPVPVTSNISKPVYPTTPAPITRDSTQRAVSQNSQIAGGNMGGYGHAFVPKADKYRTVPCKYYHSPQGCSKIDNCTFIHDEKFAGQSVPMNSSNPGMGGRPYAPGPSPYSSYPPMNPINPINPMNPMISPNIPPNYYNQPGSYPSNSGYYPPNRGNPNYQGNGYGMGQQQYGQTQQGGQYVPGQPGQFAQGQSQQPKPYGQGQPGSQYGQNQSGQYNVQSQQYSQAPQASQQYSQVPQTSQQYSQAPQASQPVQPNQAYNPNYQYYIGNNPNK